MATREFRLEQVLKFRKEVEKRQQQELAAARQEHDAACDRLREENLAMARLEEELLERQLRGMEAKDLQLYGDFSIRQRREIQGMRETITDLERAVQEKREALLVAAKEKKALEIFKEKKMRDLRREQLEKERAFLDEIAIQSRGQQK